MFVSRLSLQSHSSGSLDSMLNVSNDEERHSNMLDNHDHVFISPQNSELHGNTAFTYLCENSVKSVLIHKKNTKYLLAKCSIKYVILDIKTNLTIIVRFILILLDVFTKRQSPLNKLKKTH